MKKLLIFVAVISAFSFASCKKDRTCTCTASSVTTSTDPSYTPGTVVPDTYVDIMTKAKKGDAKKACIGKTQTDVQTYGTYTYTTVSTTTCDLK